MLESRLTIRKLLMAMIWLALICWVLMNAYQEHHWAVCLLIALTLKIAVQFLMSGAYGLFWLLSKTHRPLTLTRTAPSTPWELSGASSGSSPGIRLESQSQTESSVNNHPSSQP